VAAEGWQKTSAALFACEQVSKTFTQKLELSTLFDDFVQDKDLVRTKFIGVLAVVYATTQALISLEYFSKTDPSVVKTARRRLLSQSGVAAGTDTLVITAQIQSFQLILLPLTVSIQQAMQNAQYSVVLLPSNGTPANNGSSTPLLWIVVICSVFCALGISSVRARSSTTTRGSAHAARLILGDRGQPRAAEPHSIPRGI